MMSRENLVFIAFYAENIRIIFDADLTMENFEMKNKYIPTQRKKKWKRENDNEK